jgi:hypothetical protein
MKILVLLALISLIGMVGAETFCAEFINIKEPAPIVRNLSASGYDVIIIPGCNSTWNIWVYCGLKSQTLFRMH